MYIFFKITGGSDNVFIEEESVIRLAFLKVLIKSMVKNAKMLICWVRHVSLKAGTTQNIVNVIRG